MENQNLEALIERILETKAASLISKAVEDYIRRNEERAREFSLLERIVRVEEELKALREIQLSLLREMNARFEAIDKRFEAMEKANQQRFEAIDKRFEAMEKANQQRFEAMEKRFEALHREMNARFEAMEKANQQRFEAMEKRFQNLEKRLSFLQWFMGIGFGFLAFLITLINFLR